MSIVGPRPALPREVEQYTDYERQRLYVTPGLTCYWQVQPNRNELTFDEWMELDATKSSKCNRRIKENFSRGFPARHFLGRELIKSTTF